MIGASKENISDINKAEEKLIRLLLYLQNYLLLTMLQRSKVKNAFLLAYNVIRITILKKQIIDSFLVHHKHSHIIVMQLNFIK